MSCSPYNLRLLGTPQRHILLTCLILFGCAPDRPDRPADPTHPADTTPPLDLTLENIYGPRGRAGASVISPDGRYVAVSATGPEGSGIYLVPTGVAANGERPDATCTIGAIGSPDTVRVSGSSSATGTFWTRGSSPSWFPGSDRIVFHRGGDLWTIAIGSSEAVQLTDDEHNERAPRVSPDGRRVAFYSGRSGYQDIWVVAADATTAADDFLRTRDYVNGKVGIYGYSYGGITTMAAIARVPGVFDAAVPMAGIYDFGDAYTNADRIGRIFIRTGHSGSPEERPDIYAVSNTLARIANMDTPLLIMHGKLDVRAPYRQFEIAVAELERHGKAFESRSYPGETHGLSAAARIDMYRRAEEFFGRILRGEG